ncbi:MAG: hypothetical protein ACR2QR_06310 [Woeseiaceae bacterium]
MKPAEVLREVIYPLTNMAIVFAMLFFWLMFSLVAKAGLIGIWLLVLVAPAYFRYLLALLEARANGRSAPVPSAEMFTPADSLWTLTPLILLALLIWSGIWLEGTQYAWLARMTGFVILLVAPASLGILAITHSPDESLNPVAIARMIRVCGADYLMVPAIITGITGLLFLLAARGTPFFLIDLGTSYQTVLVFTLTGALLHSKNLAVDLHIEATAEVGEDEIARDLENDRRSVANHAYGFISRGNRDGGFAHIFDWIQKESDIDAATAWFFAEMMKWESKDAALFYAQTYLSHLLHHAQEAQALKLMSTCMHANPRWKPAADDRPHAIELAEKYQRHDLLKSLRN